MRNNYFFFWRRYFESGGAGYIVTANEGDPFDVEIKTTQRSWTDAKVGGEFTGEQLDSSIKPIYPLFKIFFW